jgi:hypothetical protein
MSDTIRGELDEFRDSACGLDGGRGPRDRLYRFDRRDLLGTYKVPGFGKEVDPKDVEVSCDKPGYKQLRVVRRSSPSSDPKIPIETECTLQRS